MKKRNIYLLLIVLTVFSSCSLVRENSFFTIYLVRHSEKELSQMDRSDPPLTPCGQQRSENLSGFLSDVPIDLVYSTDYIRTRNTALPTATSKDLKIEVYDAEKLEGFSKQLIKQKKNALIVGHSNTTAVLAGLLVGKELGEFDLDIYDRIYQVVLRKKRGQLHLLHTAFYCDIE